MAAAVKPLIATAHTIGQLPAVQGAEIVLAGRSNVGKSTLVNQMLGKKPRFQNKNMARVSQRPGCTQSVNFYRLNQKTVLVDLPGYGYVPLPRRQKEQIGGLVEHYLSKRKAIALLLHLADARLDLQPLDCKMFDWGKYFNYPYLLTLNKCDKLSRKLRDCREQQIRRWAQQAGENVKWIFVSALTGEGLPALRAIVAKSAEDFFLQQQAGQPAGE